MAQTYDEIVREWYIRLRPRFLRMLTARYPGLTLSDAENIYQDTFLSVRENILNGQVREDTSWSSYIMAIGMNKASKEYRSIGRMTSMDAPDESEAYNTSRQTQRRVEELMREYSDDELPLYSDPEAQSVLGHELTHTPEPCASIIRLYYYDEMTMEEIAAAVGYRNANTAKSKKSQCMKDLTKRVREALRRFGFFTPNRDIRNGSH